MGFSIRPSVITLIKIYRPKTIWAFFLFVFVVMNHGLVLRRKNTKFKYCLKAQNELLGTRLNDTPQQEMYTAQPALLVKDWKCIQLNWHC
jgi:hypothetical protein